VEGVGDAEGVGREASGEGDDLVDFELCDGGLGVAVEGMVTGGGSGPVDLHRKVNEVRVDVGIEDFCDDPDLVSHSTEVAAKVGGVAFRASFGEGAFAPDDGNFHWRNDAFPQLGRQGGKRITGRGEDLAEVGEVCVVIGRWLERAEEAVALGDEIESGDLETCDCLISRLVDHLAITRRKRAFDLREV